MRPFLSSTERAKREERRERKKGRKEGCCAVKTCDNLILGNLSLLPSPPLPSFFVYHFALPSNSGYPDTWAGPIDIEVRALPKEEEGHLSTLPWVLSLLTWSQLNLREEEDIACFLGESSLAPLPCRNRISGRGGGYTHRGET